MDCLYPDVIDVDLTHVEMTLGFTSRDCFHFGSSILAHVHNTVRADGLAEYGILKLSVVKFDLDTRLSSSEDAGAAMTAVEAESQVILCRY